MAVLTVDYDVDGRYFFWPRKKPGLIPGCYIAVRGQTLCTAFKDFFPRNCEVLMALKGMGNVQVTKDAAKRIAEIRAERETHYAADNMDVFSGKPFAHQIEAVEALQHMPRVAVLYEQGLGKTYIALNSIRMLKKRGFGTKAVVVCPAVTFYTWLHECEKFAPELNVRTLLGDAYKRLEARMDSDWDLLITTYDMLQTGKKSQNAYLDIAWKRISEQEKQRIIDNVAAAYPDYADTVKKFGADALKRFPESFWPMEAVRQVKKEDSTTGYILESHPDILICDEASRLINHSSQRSKSVEQIAKSVERLWLMSGTLCLGRPTDMYMPLNLLDENILGCTWRAFVGRYCINDRNNVHIVRGFKNLDKLKALADPFIISRKRSECLDLPPRTIIPVYYNIPKENRELYNSLIENECTEVKGKKIWTPLVIQKIIKCMQVLSGFVVVSDAGSHEACVECGNAKIAECCMAGIRPGKAGCVRSGSIKTDDEIIELENPKIELLRGDLQDFPKDEKLIIWAWFRHDLDAISKLLDREGISYITPDVPDAAREYEENPSLRVFLGQTAQGIGVTLNSAATSVYFSHGTALEPRLQSMDRNMRIGQSRPVFVRDYICPGSVEEEIVYLLNHKEEVRDFIQTRVMCITCANFNECVSKKTRLYGKGCIYQKDKEKAEEKHSLGLKLL